MSRSSAVTRGVRVEVASSPVLERTDPARHSWFFAYEVTITNESDRPVQLVSRHWVITDANGAVEEVRGDGVIGRQPVLRPGGKHVYTSFCPLRTSFGMMHGSYRMTVEGGEAFDAEIAPFALGEPQAIH